MLAVAGRTNLHLIGFSSSCPAQRKTTKLFCSHIPGVATKLDQPHNGRLELELLEHHVRSKLLETCNRLYRSDCLLAPEIEEALSRINHAFSATALSFSLQLHSGAHYGEENDPSRRLSSQLLPAPNAPSRRHTIDLRKSDRAPSSVRPKKKKKNRPTFASLLAAVITRLSRRWNPLACIKEQQQQPDGRTDGWTDQRSSWSVGST